MEVDADDLIMIVVILAVWSLIMTGHDSIMEGLMTVIVTAYFGQKHLRGRKEK